MKVKAILRFYYYCDSLERALDNIILKRALAAGVYPAVEKSAEKVISVINEKAKLSELWTYVDEVIRTLDRSDRSALKNYAASRGSVKSIYESVRKEWRRAAVKFRRRARRIESFADGIKLVGKYYCLLSV